MHRKERKNERFTKKKILQEDDCKHEVRKEEERKVAEGRALKTKRRKRIKRKIMN
jgi:hypothetical protein